MTPLIVLAIAGAAAVASVLGGLIALWRKPTTLFMSSVLGFASGVLLATVSLEMVPQALAKGSPWIAISGFLLGCALVYGLDLFIHRGKLAGPESQQRPSVERFYHRRRPRGTEVTVLAAATSIEELIEGLSIAITKLLPEAEERQYQQSAAIFITAGFLLILALSELH